MTRKQRDRFIKVFAVLSIGGMLFASVASMFLLLSTR